MNIKEERSGSIDGFKRIISDIASDQSTEGIMILACDQNGYTAEEVDPILNAIDVPVFGGIFPEIIHGNQKLTRGLIAAGWRQRPVISVIPDLSDASADYEKLITENYPLDKTPETMFLFVDGMAGRISALIEALFNTFGLGINFIGGGAGSLSFKHKPCLFTNSGLLADKALLIGTDIVSGIGVKHGWEKIHSALTVTESNKNEIISIDWKPAFDVYKNIVEAHSGLKFSDGNFFDISKSYPFGIQKIGTENIVRDPLMRGEDGSLICVGEVPVNSVIDILTGDKASLVDATKQAYTQAKANFKKTHRQIETIFFIDCISRVLFLEDTFQEEIDAVFSKDLPMFGALTLGELANSGKDYLEFFNKTAVVGVLDS